MTPAQEVILNLVRCGAAVAILLVVAGIALIIIYEANRKGDL
jgi:hypothetical protein